MRAPVSPVDQWMQGAFVSQYILMIWLVMADASPSTAITNMQMAFPILNRAIPISKCTSTHDISLELSLCVSHILYRSARCTLIQSHSTKNLIAKCYLFNKYYFDLHIDANWNFARIDRFQWITNYFIIINCDLSLAAIARLIIGNKNKCALHSRWDSRK